MKYRVVNKDGSKVIINGPCFGGLRCISDWHTYFVNSLSFYDSDNDPVPIDIMEKETIGHYSYFTGFSPSNFQTLQYILPDSIGTDLFIEHHEEILKHPLFSDIIVDDDGQYTFSSIELPGKQMDATIYPLLFIRNLCQYSFVSQSFEKALDAGACAIEAFFISNLFGRTSGLITENPFYSPIEGDHGVMWSFRAPLGDFVETIKGELPLVFFDLKWEDTLFGYSSNGDQCFLGCEGYKTIRCAPIHRITGYFSTLASSSAFRTEENYPEHLREPIINYLPSNDESFISFVKKVSAYVKD